MSLIKYGYLAWMMRNETRSIDELHVIQSRKLKKLIHHAYHHIRFYQNLFKQTGLHPNDIQSPEDLTHIPIIDKKDFHQNHRFDFLDNRIINRNTLKNIKTSGTSGTLLSFYINSNYDQFRKALYLRPYLSNGRKITDRALRFCTTGSAPEKWFQRIGFLREDRVDSSIDVERQIEKIKAFHPEIIQGYGTSLSLIASEASKQKIDLPRPRIVFTDSELLTPLMRNKIETGFNAPVIDIYGTYETENIAYQCRAHNGYHIAMDAVIMEFIKDGKPVNPGEKGEIVCTVLDNYAMPFIRYNLHDVAGPMKEKCTCKRTLPLLSMLSGRSDDYLVYPDGSKKSPMRLLSRFDLLADAISEFQLTQKKINLFDVDVIPGSLKSEQLKELVEQTIRSEFPDAQIDVTFKHRIDREESGKLSAIKSMID